MTEKISSDNKNFAPIPPRTQEVSKEILDAAFKVHTALGPGLLESVYEACLVYELRSSGLMVENQVALPVKYEGITIDSGFRIDLQVENCVIVELKTVDYILPLYRAQLLTYMKLTNTRVGLLINFNAVHLKEGIKRLVL